eukprot:7070667-Pyramimonas_sp.AAC.1
MSVSARIASLLDDIVTRVPEGKTMTVASRLAKAFIATAVPEPLCCLEAWHILWGLPRTASSSPPRSSLSSSRARQGRRT